MAYAPMHMRKAGSYVPKHFAQGGSMKVAENVAGRKAFMSNKKLMMAGGGVALALGYMAHHRSSARNAPMSPMSGYPSGAYGM